MCLPSICNAQEPRLLQNPLSELLALLCLFCCPRWGSSFAGGYIPDTEVFQGECNLHEGGFALQTVCTFSWDLDKEQMYVVSRGRIEVEPVKKHSTVRLIIAWTTGGLSFWGAKLTGFQGYMDKSLSSQWKYYMNTLTTVLTDKLKGYFPDKKHLWKERYLLHPEF